VVEQHRVSTPGREGQFTAGMGARPNSKEGGLKTNPLRAGADTHRSARPTTTKAHSEDVVNWLHDASQRLLEARLARALGRRRHAG
jgi:hypothetical protein